MERRNEEEVEIVSRGNSTGGMNGYRTGCDAAGVGAVVW